MGGTHVDQAPIIPLLEAIELFKCSTPMFQSKFDYAILVLVAGAERRSEDCTMTQIQRRLGVSYPTARRAIQRLVDVKIVKISSSQEDSRSTCLVFTENGRQKFGQFADQVSLEFTRLKPVLSA
ncbi:MAG: MarR family transcriptional regulator [SAR116 cluster bacterium]|jgi:Transcriptional regulators|nr:MAG: MarR family transcriptional regulator [SAR116 cluster bacterium]HBQ22448.1 hypothetical protein [Alphaproteobacteria bacterium]